MGTNLIGVGTPQANPTVEAEFRQLLPPDVPFVATRLTSTSADTRQRLVDYLQATCLDTRASNARSRALLATATRS